MLQLQVCMLQLKILHATTKTWRRQTSKHFLKICERKQSFYAILWLDGQFYVNLMDFGEFPEGAVVICNSVSLDKNFQVALVIKNPPPSAGDMRVMGSIPGLGKSPGVGHGNPLQYLAWKISWTKEPGQWQCMRSQRVRHDWNDLPAHIQGSEVGLITLEW